MATKATIVSKAALCNIITHLLKQNAKLQEKLNIRSCQNPQLAKAKELLTRFVMASVYFNGKETDLIKEAEQFLRENE